MDRPAGMHGRASEAAGRRNGRVFRWALTGFALAAAVAAPALPLHAACGVVGAPDAEHAARAASACARAQERFVLLFGAPPPPVLLELNDTVGFFSIRATAPDWTLVWPVDSGLRQHLRSGGTPEASLDAATATQWNAVLPHELGHLMLIAEADRRRRPDQAPRRLPDWFHEGTAVWMEPPSVRADDVAVLTALRPFVPSLSELTALSISGGGLAGEAGSTLIQTFFPCASEEACGGRPHWSRIFSVTTRTYPDGTTRVDTTFHERPPPPPSPVGSHFYAYSATLVRFLHDRGGPEAMSALLDRYVAPLPHEHALHGLPGLPRSPAALEREWRAWFEAAFFASSPDSS